MTIRCLFTEKIGGCRAALLLALLLAALLAGAPGRPALAQAEARPLSVAAYQARLEQARALLAAGGAKSLAAARAELAAVTTVELANGEQIQVQPLLGEAASTLTPAAALARLDALLAQLDAAAGDQLAQRLALMAAIFEEPEFVQSESFWDRFWRWLDELLDRFRPVRDPNPAASSTASAFAELLGWAVILVASVAIIWLLSYWVRGLVLNMVADAEARRREDGDSLPQTPGEARRRADSLALAGNYREAVRNLYLSALLTLEQHGLVTTDRSLTNREVLARVAPEHPIRTHLKPVVETFDDVWYGVHEPDQGTFGSYSQAIDRLATIAAGKERVAE